MSMFARPAPFPEEVDRGYLGRIMRINGFLTPQDAVRGIEVQLAEAVGDGEHLTTHELISGVAGMSAEQFALRHTPLPLRRGVKYFFSEDPRGRQEWCALLQKIAMNVKCHFACFCNICVAEDVGFHGVSYWRRDHQTVGQMWCPKHLKSLRFVTSEDPFIASPAAFMDVADHFPEELVREALCNKHVQRFLDVAATLYDRPVLLDLASVVDRIIDFGERQGFRPYIKAKGGILISDRVKDEFPARWLQHVCHEIKNKVPGEHFGKIDGVLSPNASERSMTAYLLVFSILFESADKVIDALTFRGKRMCDDPFVPQVKRKPLPSPDLLLKHYVESRGVYVEIASRLNAGVSRIHKALRELGLPNLPYADGESDGGVVAGLMSYYLYRNSYSHSLKISGLTASRFDSILRTCGPQLIRALRMMRLMTKPRSKSHQLRMALPSQHLGINCA